MDRNDENDLCWRRSLLLSSSSSMEFDSLKEADVAAAAAIVVDITVVTDVNDDVNFLPHLNCVTWRLRGCSAKSRYWRLCSKKKY